jgi:hypothetical protein
MSSTAMAATDETRNGESIQTKELAILANFVELLTLNLKTTTVNFGDVFTGATVEAVTVTADVTGDADETYTFNISTGTNSHVLINGNDVSTNALITTGENISGSATTFSFEVGLDTSSEGITADVSENVTVSITYDAIEATSTLPVEPA